MSISIIYLQHALIATLLPKIVTPHPHGVLSHLYYAKQPAVVFINSIDIYQFH